MPHLAVVIPVYDAQELLRELYDRLKKSIELFTKDFEIILVDDCSNDRSWEIVKELAKQDKRVRGIRFSRNFGQHYAITAGLDHCDSDWAVVMDCDLQDSPEEIPRLYQKAGEGYDVVVAVRNNRKDSIFKRCSSWCFYKVFNALADMKYDARIGNFRIVSRKTVDYFRMMRERLRFFGGMIDWMGFSTTSIIVEHEKGGREKSTYTLRKLITLAMDTILAYSDKPLKISIRCGFTMSGIAFFYGVFIYFKALFFKVPVPGWSSLIVSLYFLSGIIIVILGILGVYLGKVFDETKKRPLYIISKRTDETR